ncbi:MAG: hypothetical protein AB1345_01980 [Chloroflexota bacterium]
MPFFLVSLYNLNMGGLLRRPKFKLVLVTIVVLLFGYLYLGGRQGVAQDVVFDGRYAYVAMGEFGVQVWDLINPHQPQQVSNLDTLGSANGVAWEGGYLYVSDGEEGLHILSAGNPTNLQEVGSVTLPGVPEGVTVINRVAYVATGEDGLRSVDVYQPEKPYVLGHIDLEGYAQDVVVQGGLAFVTARNEGFYIISVVDPANPGLFSFVSTSSLRDVDVNGPLAYIADGPGGLKILDVSSPSGPRQVGSFVRETTQGKKFIATAVRVVGPYVLLGTESNGLLVINASLPDNPVLLTTLHYSEPSQSVEAWGEWVAVALGRGGVKWLKREAVDQLQEVARIETPGEPTLARLFSSYFAWAKNFDNQPSSKVIRTGFTWILEILILLLLGLYIWIFFFSQFVLPVRTLKERWQSFKHLSKYLWGSHGPAIFIRSGEIVERMGETKKKRPGVILLDTASAAVLRKREKITRTVGPGVVFTKGGEEVEEAVDLRLQRRTLGPQGDEDPFGPQTGEGSPSIRYVTRAITRDDVEVIPNITVEFRLRCEPGKGNTEYGFEEDPVNNSVIRKSIDVEAPSETQDRYFRWNEFPPYLAVDLWREYVNKFTLTQLFEPVMERGKRQLYDKDDQLVQLDGISETGLEVIARLVEERMTQERVEELDETGRPTGRKVPSDEYWLLRKRGIQVQKVRITNLRLPSEVEQKLVDRWQSLWLHRAKEERVFVENLQNRVISHSKEMALNDYVQAIFEHLGRIIKDKELPPEGMQHERFEYPPWGIDFDSDGGGAPQLSRKRSLAVEFLARKTLELCRSEPTLRRNLLAEEDELVNLIAWAQKQRG